MKTISKTTLAAAVVAGAALLSSTSAFAFDGDGQGVRDGRMRGDRQGEHAQIGDRQGKRSERPHLISKEMMDQFREEHKDLSDEEKAEFREERKSHREERRAEVADFAGLSTDEMREARKNGDSLGDVLTQNGKTREDAENFLTQTANEHVGEIAEKHNLDEGQKASVQENVSSFVNSILDRWFR